jgi:flagellar biosynthesis chaperone FliJ
MRLVTKYEDQKTQEHIKFLEDLVEAQRTEIFQMRAQIDEIREIPPIFMPNDRPARVQVMNDKNVVRLRNGESIEE